MSSETNKAHDVILNTLNRKHGDGRFLRAEAFAKNLDAWEGTPLVFVPPLTEHPDPNRLNADPGAELRRLKATIAGVVLDPKLNMTGHPTLDGRFDISEGAANKWLKMHGLDASFLADIDAIEELNRVGELSHSTAFFADGSKTEVTGGIEPNHVLLFRETRKDQPKDQGAMILNKELDMNDAKIDRKGLVEGFSQLLDKMLGRTEQTTDGETMENKELVDKLAATSAELAEKKIALAHKEAEAKDAVEKATKMEAELKSATEKLTESNKALEVYKQTELQAKQKADWESLKPMLPPGLFAKEKEAEAFKSFTENPAAFTLKALEAHKKFGNTGAEGATTQTLGAPSKKGLGVWNAHKKAYEEDVK